MNCRSRGAYRYWVTSLAMAIVLPAWSLAGSDHSAGATTSAHRHGPGILNHPVHVIPSSNVHVPAGWPLSPRGEITCSTCHKQWPGSERAGNAYLRGADQPEGSTGLFCANCHDVGRSDEVGGMHWRALRVAHIMPERRAGGGRSAGLDKASRLCLQCHDGINASEVAHTIMNGRGSAWGSNELSHPVGVAYPTGSARGRDSAYKPRTALPRTVRLPQGAVSCVSCHDLYSVSDDRLTVPIEGSRLCLTCHDMD